MTNRRWYRGWLPLALAGGIFALLVISLYSTKSPLDRFRERIAVGSTYEEVVEAIGKPPGDYTTREYFWPPLGLSPAFADGWTFDGYLIQVGFDAVGRVSYFEIYDGLVPINPNSWERFWVGR